MLWKPTKQNLFMENYITKLKENSNKEIKNSTVVTKQLIAYDKDYKVNNTSLFFTTRNYSCLTVFELGKFFDF